MSPNNFVMKSEFDDGVRFEVGKEVLKTVVPVNTLLFDCIVAKVVLVFNWVWIFELHPDK